MEIHALNLVLTEQDLNGLVGKHLPANQPVEDLHVAITPRGVTVTGVYPLFINVRFETRWELRVENNGVAARLGHFKAMGVPGNIFKSAIMKVIEDLAREEPWLRRDGDCLWIDVEAAIVKFALPARLNLKQIDCQAGQLLVFAGK